MKIYELVEQTVGTVPPGAGAPLGTTQPTVSGTANTGTNATQQMGQQPANTQNMSNIKNNINNLKGMLGAASGGDVDANKISQALANPSLAANPSYMKSIMAIMPGLADALQNNQAAAGVKTAIKTGVDAQQKVQQLQQQKAQQTK